MLILAILTRKESYGYELVVQLEDEGLTEIAAGTVYPILTRLEREGLLTFRLIASATGPARKYYSPTPDGERHLSQALEAWTALNTVVHNITAAKG